MSLLDNVQEIEYYTTARNTLIRSLVRRLTPFTFATFKTSCFVPQQKKEGRIMLVSHSERSEESTSKQQNLSGFVNYGIG